MSYFGFQDKTFYRQMLRIAIPIMLQQAVSSSITMIDNMMIGRLSDHALAAVTHANQVSFLLFVFVFGITSASTAFTAQYWGKGDMQAIRRTLGVALICCIVIGTLFLSASQLFSNGIIGLFAKEAAVQQLGVDYLRIVSFTYPMITITHAYASVLRGTERVRLPMTSAIIGIVTNAVLNYILIFGKLGMPAMGVKGAAIATVIAQAVDMSIILVCSYVMKTPIANRQHKMFPVRKAFVSRFAKVGIPVFINESLWSLAQVTTMFIYAQLGTQMSAAMGIFTMFERICFTVFIGLGNACAVMVGKEIGSGEEQTAFTYAQRCLRLAPVIAVVVAVVINLLMPALLSFYTISGETIGIVRNTVRIFSLELPLVVFNYTAVIGILRSGGDTRYSLLVDSGMHWCITVVLVALGTLVLRLPPQWVYICVVPGEVVKSILGGRRFASRKWIHNLTN